MSKPGRSEEPRRAPTVAVYRERIRRRWYRTLNYASIAFTALVAYGSFLVADYLLVTSIEWLFRAEIKGSRFASAFFEAVKLGLAMIAFLLCVVHGARSAWAQYKLDKKLTGEEE